MMRILLLLLCFPWNVLALPASSDMDKPLNINADNLVVLQDNSQAVFSGNVIATQGEIILKSDKMTVFYRNNEAKRPDQNAISRVEVLGHVVLTTPQEAAESNKGYYDMDDGIIKLLGNVTLNQNETIIKGESFVYNMITGQSQMQNQASSGGKKGRVQMYIPNTKDLKDPTNKEKAAP